MVESSVMGVVEPDPRWRDMYRIGFVASVALAVAIVAAVVIYFIWPYTPGFTSVAELFADLEANRLVGLLKMDLSVPFVTAILIFQLLALYVALKDVNPSYALIALVLGLMECLLFFVARPLIEMAYLSEQYAAATTESARLQYLAAGEALSALFNGTGWVISQLFIATSMVLNSLLMLRSPHFSKAAAYVGIVNGVLAYGIVIPVYVVAAITGLGATIGSVAWDIMLARSFYRMGWGDKKL